MYFDVYRSQRRRNNTYKRKSNNMNIKLHTNSKGSQDDGDVIMEDCLAYGKVSAELEDLTL